MAQHWKSSWDAWCERLDRVVDVAKFYGAVDVMHGHHVFAKETLIPDAKELFEALVAFEAESRESLPIEVRNRLSKFIEKGRSIFGEYGTGVGPHEAALLLGTLGGIRSATAYYLRDPSLSARNDVERALVHLQRLIVASEHARDEWRCAFDRGELEAEKLGAVHLLQHGIWAFKADAITGGRTDLVLGHPLKEEEVQRSGSALVLTEWKRITDCDDPARKAHEAQVEAEKYSSGPLLGFELASTRYVILVSRGHLLPVPTLPATGPADYQVRNIAVEPESPSKVARKAVRKRKR